MHRSRLAPVVVAVALAAGCSSPAGPSGTTSTNTTTDTQAVVGSSVNQAVAQAAAAAPMSAGLGAPLTTACPQGGSIVTTFLTPLAGGATAGTLTAKTEYDNCRFQTVTVNGDPYLLHTDTFTITSANGVTTATGTMRTTGGVRFDANSIQGTGRVQYDCTTTFSDQFTGGTATPTVSMTWSGTVTWEQPLGTVTTRPCGPS